MCKTNEEAHLVPSNSVDWVCGTRGEAVPGACALRAGNTKQLRPPETSALFRKPAEKNVKMIWILIKQR